MPRGVHPRARTTLLCVREGSDSRIGDPGTLERSLSGAFAPRFVPSMTAVLPRGYPPSSSMSLCLVTLMLDQGLALVIFRWLL